MADDILLIHGDGPLTSLTLNDPARLNALSTAMLTRLDAALDAIAASGARVVILRANGKTFCAGHDLREIQGLRNAPDRGAAAFTALFTLCAAVMQKIAALSQPVIAQVQGTATAAGCQLAASCDMVVAADNARFGVNGVNIGLFCHTPLVALSHKIAPAQAFEMAATGDFISAGRAQTLGLVTRLARPTGAGDAVPRRSPRPETPPCPRLGQTRRRPPPCGGLCQCHRRHDRKPAGARHRRRHSGLPRKTPAKLGLKTRTPTFTFTLAKILCGRSGGCKTLRLYPSTKRRRARNTPNPNPATAIARQAA